MDLELGKRRALVTGSTAGIGYAIARGLAAEGAQVVITGRTQSSVDGALARLRKELPKANAEGIAADCATAEGAQAVFARVAEVDILVNNLGIYGRMPFFEIPDAEWLRYFEVNVLSGVRFARRYALLPGPTRTENTERMRAERAKAAGKTVAEIEEGFFRDYRPTSILRRFTSADEVANLAVYLCGAGASATTGAALRADGGVVNQIM